MDSRFHRKNFPGQGYLIPLFSSVSISAGWSHEREVRTKWWDLISLLILGSFSLLGVHREGSEAQDSAAVTEIFGGFQSLEFASWGLSHSPDSTARGFSSPSSHHPGGDLCVFISASPLKYPYQPLLSAVVDSLGALFFYSLHYLKSDWHRLGI